MLKSREVKAGDRDGQKMKREEEEAVGYHVLQRMSVDGDDSDGSGPLMVLFVEMFVEAGMVEQPERKDDQSHMSDLSLH